MNEALQKDVKTICKHIFEEVNAFKEEYAHIVITPNEYGKNSIDVFYDINSTAFDERSAYIYELLTDLFFIPFPFQEEEEKPKRYCIRQEIIKDVSEIAAFCVKNIYNPNRKGKRNSEDFIVFLSVICSLFTKNYTTPDDNTQDAIVKSFVPYLDKEKYKLLSEKESYTYSFYPSTDAAAFMSDSIANIKNLKTYQQRQKEVSHGNRSISYSVGNTSTKIKSETKNPHGTNQIVEFDNKVLSKMNKAAAKLLVFVLSEAQKQTHNGTLSSFDISFPVSDLVDCGMYFDAPTARRGFDNAMQSLTSVKWSEMDKTLTDYNLQVYFTGARIKNGICTVQFNDRLNWKEFFKQYTYIDPKIYSLSDINAFRLMVYIFTQARQESNRKPLVEHGYFEISIKSIALHLGLPDTRPKEYIIDPIEKAVNEAEKLYSQKNGGDNFLGFEFVNYDLPTRQFIEDGKLRVYMKGDYIKDFVAADKRLTTTKTKAIKKNEQKKAEKGNK